MVVRKPDPFAALDVYGKTRKDVASRLPKLLQDVQEGTVIVDERTTMGNYL